MQLPTNMYFIQKYESMDKGKKKKSYIRLISSHDLKVILKRTPNYYLYLVRVMTHRVKHIAFLIIIIIHVIEKRRNILSNK
jgi:hypothetical protein